ncbi:hydroxymethylglutaryl-CoA synthase family protein [Streptomyces cinerochromogenes]|uniref:hydroxymethylglutaryl-CoA synthase family protein n=1 Tax=Streptomyces cinerochromogenes TaxID=66422 RepID=UPI0016701A8D|nr:hydroxymethylglutaryl-CoA synthase family protein [Streptomyces cinerochromogenes]GGS55007.1 polyketide biosynthesis 3-hydroxy-3-methylglutaryl-ACP synthase PksG [Streptomyces cinerochromogenes]
MSRVGIEAMNVFGGSAVLDVAQLARRRGLDPQRLDNLLMREKTVALPFEDPVTFGANAARPLLDRMSPQDRDRIELLITCTESGIDFSKSVSTYLHDQLGLSRNCRMFELKQACYAGTAGLQMACNFILSQTSPGAKALVIATDISRYHLEDGADASAQDWSYAEPSGGAGAVAMLISDVPHVFRLDVGASGTYGYEVMDTCRPAPDSESGDVDLSLMSYLDCCEQSYRAYERKVEGADYRDSFQYLAFHTPFGGMVKGAHRTMMRKVAGVRGGEIAEDFERRVAPGLAYCGRVGNVMGATVFLSLASTVCNGDFDSPKRIGLFSYGSGCCSEFYSGVVTPDGATRLKETGIGAHLDARHRLTIDAYETLLAKSDFVRFGTRDTTVDQSLVPATRPAHGTGPRLVLRAVKDFHREYAWVD